MLDAPIDRTRVTTAALPRNVQLGAEADHERRSGVEPLPLWWNASSAINVSFDINILPLKTEINQRVPASPSRDYSFKLEITFCVRGVASPLLANLFLHYALDRWLAVHYPQVPFERYADDVIVHCKTEKQAQEMRKAIAKRLQTCGLELHPEKTKIVYCKDDSRKGTYSNESFTFLSYTFQPRKAKSRKGKFFINFSPAVSEQAAKDMRDTIRSWKLPKRSDQGIEELSRMFNPIVRGWLQYYGRYYRSALYPMARALNRDLALWAVRKYKKLRRHLRRATHWIARISRRAPGLFALWQIGARRGSVTGAV